MTDSARLWVQSVRSTLDDLRRPDAVTLISGERSSASELLRALGDALSISPASVTEVALTPAPAASERELLQRLSGRTVLFDLETICWVPWLQLDPLRLLRQQARRHGVVAVWPGQINGSVLSFSAPGRRDYVSVDAPGITVMRPTTTRFPDEVPFTIERAAGERALH